MLCVVFVVFELLLLLCLFVVFVFVSASVVLMVVVKVLLLSLLNSFFVCVCLLLRGGAVEHTPLCKTIVWCVGCRCVVVEVCCGR